MAKSVTQAYVNSLLKAVRQPTPILAELNQHWPALERHILRQRRELSRRISSDDPIRYSVDILTPLNRILDETTHTRAIAFLLDPSESHGFGKATLRAVLARLQRRKGASEVAALLRKEHTRVAVFSEYRYSIMGSKARSAARNDIRIEIRNGSDAALIVIENKIDAPESNGQLGWYEAEARKWRKKNKGRSLLVYLARKKRQNRRDDDQWLGLSYLDLASAFRDVWRRNRSAPGSTWLALYIASITRGVLGIDVDRLQDTTIEEIEAYIGRER